MEQTAKWLLCRDQGLWVFVCWVLCSFTGVCKACPTRMRFFKSCIALRHYAPWCNYCNIHLITFYLYLIKLSYLQPYVVPHWSCDTKHVIVCHYQNCIVLYRDETQHDAWKRIRVGEGLTLALDFGMRYIGCVQWGQGMYVCNRDKRRSLEYACAAGHWLNCWHAWACFSFAFVCCMLIV